MKIDSFIKSAENFIYNVLFQNIPKLIVALLILWIGLKLLKYLKKIFIKLMKKKEVDVSLQSFLASVVDIALKILLFITVMGMIGIQMTSFIALLGAAGLAIGMALQGTLQNFAGGIIVLILKPYRVGDFIEQGGISGTVQTIQIFNTIIVTLDNKVVVVPNTELATKTLTNYSKMEQRRVDIDINIMYGESVDKAREVILQMVNQYPLTLQTPGAPSVFLVNLSDSAVSLEVRVWVATADYWQAKFELTQAVYDKFNEVGIVIPFNQLDVHIVK